MKFVTQIITKLTPKGLVIVLLALLVLIGFVIYFGNIAIDGGFFNFESEARDEAISDTIDTDDDANGVRDNRPVQTKRKSKSNSGTGSGKTSGPD